MYRFWSKASSDVGTDASSSAMTTRQIPGMWLVYLLLGSVMCRSQYISPMLLEGLLDPPQQKMCSPRSLHSFAAIGLMF